MTPAERFDRLCSAILGVYDRAQEARLCNENIAAAYVLLACDARDEGDHVTAQRALVIADVWDPAMTAYLMRRSGELN